MSFVSHEMFDPVYCKKQMAQHMNLNPKKCIWSIAKMTYLVNCKKSAIHRLQILHISCIAENKQQNIWIQIQIDLLGRLQKNIN